jgi:hypothetical protein
MIEFIFKGISGKIDKEFNVFFEDKEKQEFLQKMLDIFLFDLKPSSGDPFLMFAEELKSKGFQIKKVVPENEGKEEIY